MKTSAPRRRITLAPACEPLESRHLLSTASLSTASPTSAKLTRDINRYYQQIDSLQLTTRIPAAQLTTLQTDATAIHYKIKTPPSNAALAALTKTLKSFHGRTFTPAYAAAFQTGLTTVFTSAGVTDTTLVQKDVTDQLAAISAAGITPKQLAKVAAIEQAIAKDSGGAQTGAVGIG